MRNLQPIEYNKVCAGDKKYQTLWNTSIERIKPNENFIVKSFEAVGAEYQAINHKESIGQKSMSKNFPDIYKNYLNGLKNLESIQKGKWFNKQTAKLGSLGIFSDFKSLDTNNTKTVDQLFPNGYKT